MSVSVLAMVLSPNIDREKQISTDSIFFAGGQASLDICLSFDCLGSSFKKLGNIEKEARRLRTAFKDSDA